MARGSMLMAFREARRAGRKYPETVDAEDVEIAFLMLQQMVEKEGRLCYGDLLKSFWFDSDDDVMYVRKVVHEAIGLYVDGLLADGSVAARLAGLSEIEMHRHLFDDPVLCPVRWRIMDRLAGEGWLDIVWPLPKQAV